MSYVLETKVENPSIPVESGHLGKLAVGAISLAVRQHIRDALTLLAPGELVELRIANKHKKDMYVGYFDDFDTAADIAQGFSEGQNAKAIWYCINSPSADCKARSYNRMTRGISSTGENDIVRIKRLILDFDPDRLSDTSSTWDQYAEAQEKALTVRSFFRAIGWPEPAYLSSGNGCQLVWATDLEPGPETKKLIEAWTAWAVKKWSDPVIKLDKSVHKPAQLGRLPGTWNRKGDNLQSNPHRLARLIEAPARLDPVTADQIRASFADEPAETPAPRYLADAQKELERLDAKSQAGGGKSFDLKAFFEKYDVEVTKSVPDTWHGDTGTMHVLAACPFNEEHRSPDSAIFQADGGALKFRCLHSSCSEKRWKDVRQHYDPECYTKKEQPATKPTTRPAAEPKPDTRRGYRLSELKHIPPPSWLIKDHVQDAGLTIVFGASGGMKTFFSLDMALSVACGVPFLGKWEVKRKKVAYIISEGAHGFRKRIDAWFQRHNIDPAEAEEWFCVIPAQFNLQEEGEADRVMQIARDTIGGAEVFLIDTLTRNFGPGNPDSNEDMAKFVLNVDHVRDSTEATVIVVHHTGWAVTDRERSAASLRDSATASFQVSKVCPGEAVINCRKQKDGEEIGEYFVKAKKIDLGSHLPDIERYSLSLGWAGSAADHVKEEKNTKDGGLLSKLPDEPVTLARAMELWAMKETTADRNLKGFVTAGDLVIGKNGKANSYSLTPQGITKRGMARIGDMLSNSPNDYSDGEENGDLVFSNSPSPQSGE